MGYSKNLNIIIISTIIALAVVISSFVIYPYLIKTEAKNNLANNISTNISNINLPFACEIPKTRTDIINPSKIPGLDGYIVIYLGYSKYSQYILCSLYDVLTTSGNNNLIWLNQTGNILAHILFIDGYWLSNDQNLINSIGYIREHLINGRAVIILDFHKINVTLLIEGLRDLLDERTINRIYERAKFLNPSNESNESDVADEADVILTSGVNIHLSNLDLPNSPPVENCIKITQEIYGPFKSNAGFSEIVTGGKYLVAYYSIVVSMFNTIFGVYCAVER